MSEWISVEDRLPAHELEVLVLYKGNAIQGGIYLSDEGLEWWFELLDGWYIDWNNVTHWQPLPQPPQGY